MADRHPDVEAAEDWLDEQLSAEDVVAQAERITGGHPLTAAEAHGGTLDDDVADGAFRHLRALRALCRDEDECEHHDDARRVRSRLETYFTEPE